MRILFLSSWYPYPPNNGSKIRIHNLTRGLVKHHDLTLIAFTEGTHHIAFPDYSVMFEKVLTVTRREYNPYSVRALLGLVSKTPRAIGDTHSQKMENLIRREISEGNYDLVIASQWQMASYWQVFGEVPAIYEEIELGVFEKANDNRPYSLSRLRQGLTLFKLREYLKQILPRFQFCTVVSEKEQELLQKYVPSYSNVVVVPNCVDVPSRVDRSLLEVPHSIIFTGSLTYNPNYEAVQWFIREVLPRIHQTVPHARFIITGDHAHKPLPNSNQVTLTGLVDDIRPYLSSAWVSVVPIQEGGGTRLKILEAMSLSTPVVSTTKGAEGLAANDGEHLLLRDNPDGFAEAVVRLFFDADLHHRISENAYAFVQKNYAWDVVVPEFLSLIENSI